MVFCHQPIGLKVNISSYCHYKLPSQPSKPSWATFVLYMCLHVALVILILCYLKITKKTIRPDTKQTKTESFLCYYVAHLPCQAKCQSSDIYLCSVKIWHSAFGCKDCKFPFSPGGGWKVSPVIFEWSEMHFLFYCSQSEFGSLSCKCLFDKTDKCRLQFNVSSFYLAQCFWSMHTVSFLRVMYVASTCWLGPFTCMTLEHKIFIPSLWKEGNKS